MEDSRLTMSSGMRLHVRGHPEDGDGAAALDGRPVGAVAPNWRSSTRAAWCHQGEQGASGFRVRPVSGEWCGQQLSAAARAVSRSLPPGGGAAKPCVRPLRSEGTRVRHSAFDWVGLYGLETHKSSALPEPLGAPAGRNAWLVPRRPHVASVPGPGHAAQLAATAGPAAAGTRGPGCPHAGAPVARRVISGCRASAGPGREGEGDGRADRAGAWVGSCAGHAIP